mmetsp:Transcript_9861/g.14843  ORF Transcript_9861/g.14843 Transcript_9861/m.14843 type:complete len:780 (+) Transcript_9861:2-2341(+)
MAPTMSPTHKPTESPTEYPTGAPTESPTEAPTEYPTGAPTMSPTHKPTESPTEYPTGAPTDSPTGKPTEYPTGAPTMSPTEAPTGGVCANVLTEDNLVKTVTKVKSSYKVIATLSLDQVVCSSDSNVMQLGCKPNPILTVTAVECTSQLKFEFFLENGSSQTCTPSESLDLGVEYEININVEDDVATVKYGNTEVCSMNLDDSSMTGDDVCLYASAPDMTPAYACSISVDVAVTPLTTCFYCDEKTMQQKICRNSNELVEFGDCQNCCTADSTIINPIDDQECRTLEMEQPYCDVNDKDYGSKCNMLKNKNGMLTFEFIYDDVFDKVCCKSCTCYGDPECISFAGQEDKWILCDARDNSCKPKEDRCSLELDHTGKPCVWDTARADALRFAADIGAIGSPCQPDWDNSENIAEMTMYETGDFSARITMGERGVIEDLYLDTAAGKYTLDADRCFEDDRMAAWITREGAPVESALLLRTTDGPGPDERTWEITDPVSRIFVHAVCIERISKAGNGKYQGYRMNIRNLVETDEERTGEGFCVEGVIDTGPSTTVSSDAIYDTCRQGMDDAHLLCKRLWNPSCTPSQIPLGVTRWCENANVYPDDPNRIEKCKSFIGTSANKWAQLFCDSVSSQRGPLSPAQWRKQCVSRIDNDGPDAVINDIGQGTYVVSGTQFCGSNENDYAPRTPGSGQCTPGVSIEYMDTNGEWHEALFVPNSNPPCEGILELSAKKHYELFTRPMRVKQCNINPLQCAIDAACLPNTGITIKYLYSQDQSVCPTDSR